MFYSGIDLHKNMSFVTTLDNEGDIVKQDKLPNDEHAILNYFYSIGKHHKVVVECIANWYWLSDLLSNHGIELVLAHAKYLKAISYAKVKTDKVDSFTLARLLRINMIPVAHQISPENRDLRDLMRARLKLVRKNTSCQNSIHRIFEKHNITIPENRKLHDLSTFDLLLDLPLSSDQKFQLDLLKQQIELLHAQIKNLEQSLHSRLLINDDIQRLLWIPGIGRILAFTIYLEVDGIDRFPDVNRFHSYCRLVPGSNNSNKKVKHKSGNKDGNKYLKMAFTEASVRSVQYFKEIKQFYQSKARKKHKCIARNIVAGEIAKICYYVLKTKTDFNNTFKGITLSKRKTMQWPRLASPDV